MEQSNNKKIAILLGIILILVIIFSLKFLGIIKPAPKQVETSTNVTNSISNDNNENVIENKNRNFEDILDERIDYKYTDKEILVVSIIIFAIEMVISFGTAKLYSKLGMPHWTVTYTKVYPIVMVISSILIAPISGWINLVISIISLIILADYYYSVGMSKEWPLIIVLSAILIYFAFEFGIVGFIIGSMVGILLLIASYVGIIIFIISYIIANIKVAKAFGKGIIFKIGMALLPFIFQPILGYQREKTFTKEEQFEEEQF